MVGSFFAEILKVDRLKCLEIRKKSSVILAIRTIEKDAVAPSRERGLKQDLVHVVRGHDSSLPHGSVG